MPAKADGLRRAVWTPEKKALFLEELAKGLSPSHCARVIDYSRAALYRRRDEDPEFRAAWEDAIEAGTDTLEDEARKRAFGGSDTLLIFMLKGRRPEKYRDNYTKPESEAGSVTIRIIRAPADGTPPVDG